MLIHEIKMKILRKIIRQYVVHDEVSDLLTEIEYIRANVFYEDNFYDAREWWNDKMSKMLTYVLQRRINL